MYYDAVCSLDRYNAVGDLLYFQIVRSVGLASTVSMSATAATPLNSAIRYMAIVGRTVNPAGPVHTAKVILTKYKSLLSDLVIIIIIIIIINVDV